MEWGREFGTLHAQEEKTGRGGRGTALVVPDFLKGRSFHRENPFLGNGSGEIGKARANQRRGKVKKRITCDRSVSAGPTPPVGDFL